MRTSILQYIAVCLLIASFASVSNVLGNSHRRSALRPEISFKSIQSEKLNWYSYNLSKYHYAPRNSDSDYLKAFKDHLRYLHENLDYLTLECCRETRSDKSAICDPKVVKPSEEVKIKDESQNRRKEIRLLRRFKLDMHGRTLGIRCSKNGDVVTGLREEESNESKKIVPFWNFMFPHQIK